MSNFLIGKTGSITGSGSLFSKVLGILEVFGDSHPRPLVDSRVLGRPAKDRSSVRGESHLS